MEDLDALPLMIWRAGPTPDRFCEYFNRRWLNYRGRQIEEELGAGWVQGVHYEDLGYCLQNYSSHVRERTGFQIQYRLQRRDGAYRWVIDSAEPCLTDEGELTGFIGCCMDTHDRVTHQQSLTTLNQALRQQNEELLTFTYGASHDLSEPLRTIATFAKLLLDKGTSEEKTKRDEYAAVVVKNVERMQRLIHDLLHYCYLTHRPDSQLRELDCNQALKQVLLICQAAIQETGAEISHEPLPSIRADEVQFMQLLQNLITNAIKYRRPNVRPRVHISAVQENEHWLFQITDNGIGFEPQYAERIFGLFKRLHAREQYSGTGLGLAIARKIVERQGGQIWATSEPGLGSKFFFTVARQRE